MRRSRVRSRWDSGKPVLATVAGLTDPASPELISLLGFDCIWIDVEHQATSVETVGQMIRASRVGNADVMARTGKGEFMRMGRLLEAGAMGIMYPRCESPEEAKEVIRWSKFSPLGERGFFGTNPDQPYGSMDMLEYVEFANRETFMVIQVESPEAVKQAGKIAEVEGVDVVFFGPGDFSLLAGIPGQFDNPVLRKACRETARQTIDAGKRFGTLVFNEKQAEEVLDMGASLICYGMDLMFLKTGLEKTKEAFAKLGVVFNEQKLDSKLDMLI